MTRNQGPFPDALKDLAWVAAAAAMLIAIPYSVSGLVGALSQDGMNEAIRRGLGFEAPLPLRIFRALQAWAPSAIAVASLASLLHVVARRALRRSVSLGSSFAWDVLLSPLLTAAVMFGAVALWNRGGFAGPGRDALGNGALAAAWTLALLSAAGLCIWSLTRSKALRLAGGALLLLVPLAAAGAEVWGRVSLAAYDERSDAAVMAERQRRAATLRPTLRGEPLDADAAPRYRSIFDSIRPAADQGWNAFAPLREAGDADPFAPLSPAAKTLLEGHRAAIAELRTATRCRRCLLGVDFDPAVVFGGRSATLPIRWLAAALVVEGHEHAQGGDLRGAAERYLDVVRFGGDVAPCSSLSALIGGAVEESGLVALGRLVLSGRLEASLVEQIERERAVLEANRASLADGFRCDRLFWGHLQRTIRVAPVQAGLDEPVILPALIPYRALAAHAVSAADPVHRRLEAALRAGDRDAWEAAEREALAVAGSSNNFMLRSLRGYGRSLEADSSPFGLRLFLSGLKPLAWHRLVQAAVALRRAEGGRSLAGVVELPQDPFGNGAPLRSVPAGSGHRLWSVGYDGKDDGGLAEKGADIVLSRSDTAR